MQLLLPEGFELVRFDEQGQITALTDLPPATEGYGGADISGYNSGDGYEYWSATCKHPDGWFGQAVFKQRGAQVEAVPLPRVTGRGQLCLGIDGLWLYVWHERTPMRLKIEGFVGNLHVETTSGIDAIARQMAAAAQQVADTAYNLGRAVDTRLTDISNAVQARPTREEVEATAWQKALDALDWVWARWYGYNDDPRLFNLLWDRSILLLERLKLIPVGSQKLNDPARWGR